MRYRPLELEALAAGTALDEALTSPAVAPLVKRLLDAIRAANTEELSRSGYRTDTSALPCVRFVDARFPGLRHLAGVVKGYTERPR